MCRIQLFYKYRSGYKLFLIDVTTNLCDYINGDGASKLMDFMFPAVQKYSVRKIKCPFTGSLNIKNMPINWGIFNYAFLPTGSFLLNVTLNANRNFHFNGKIYFNVPEGKTVEDDRMG